MARVKRRCSDVSREAGQASGDSTVRHSGQRRWDTAGSNRGAPGPGRRSWRQEMSLVTRPRNGDPSPDSVESVHIDSFGYLSRLRAGYLICVTCVRMCNCVASSSCRRQGRSICRHRNVDREPAPPLFWYTQWRSFRGTVDRGPPDARCSAGTRHPWRVCLPTTGPSVDRPASVGAIPDLAALRARGRGDHPWGDRRVPSRRVRVRPRSRPDPRSKLRYLSSDSTSCNRPSADVIVREFA